VLHLRTLGALDLRTSEGASVGILLAQPRSSGLLIYLLLARPGAYVTRDTLCAMFWPDADDEHARGALSQALTRIRRAAGEAVLEPRGRSELRVVPGAVGCDVLAFEEAVKAGDTAAALALYAGPFLAGFHVPSAPGFEGWVEVERDRLRSLAAGAAADLARQELARGRLAEAGRAAARALGLAPESEAVAGDLVRRLWDAGDRAGALALYETWATTMARQLELEPSPELQGLAAELRAEGRAPVMPSAPSASRAPEASVASDPGPVPDPQPAPDPRQRPGPRGPGRWRPARRVATGTAAGALMLLAGWALVHVGIVTARFPVEATGGGDMAFAARDWLVVADFDAPSVDPALALAFQTLLIRDVESAGYASVVGGLGALSKRALEDVLTRMRVPPDTRVDAGLACEIAEREGAAGVLAGRVLPLGDDYVLAAFVLAPGDCRELIRVSTVAGFDQLSDAVAALSRELRTRLGESRSSIRSSPPLPPAAASYIQALRAVSHYLSGPELWDDGGRGAAPLLEALEVEPDLSVAHFLLALHYQRLGWYAQAVPHLLRAYELRSQLPRQGRLGMEALHQRYIQSDPRASVATVETIIADHPAIADATIPFLADLALWTEEWDRALDVSLAYLRRGASGFSAHVAYTRAIAAAWALGRVELADSLHGVLVRATAAAGSSPERSLVLLHHLRHRDWRGAEALCADHLDWDRCGHLYLARGRLAAAEAVFGRILADGAARPVGNDRRQPWDLSAAVAGLVHLELLRGRPDSAWSVLQRTDRSLPMVGPARAGMHLSRFLFCAASVGLDRSTELPECAIEQEDRATWDADPSFAVVLRSGAWSYRLLAVRALERGDPTVALEYVRAAVRGNFGGSGLVDHLIQGLAFDALDRPDSALVHYLAATRIEKDGGFPTAAAVLFPLAPIHRRIGELAEAAGDPATAARHYGAFLELWADADPELQPQVRAIRERLARRGRRSWTTFVVPGRPEGPGRSDSSPGEDSLEPQ
jgi:DNA-binding SARP family transcriptional activator/tetratricopeptide (TPR) repeat protein